MKKSFLKLALAALTIGLLGSCSKINERLDNLEKKVDGIENEQIASINSQIDGIKTSIVDLGTIRSDINSLKQSASNHSVDIFNLEEADRALADRIVNLEDYVDAVLPNYAEKEWVEATFSTLEQYEATCDTIAKIDARIGALDAKLSKDIKATADSLTKWVNKQFEGYYTAAEMDAKLAQMKSAVDSAKASGKITDAKADSIATELTNAKAAVDTAKANIRAEYRAAIDTAIKTSEGKLTKALNDAITEVNGRITSLTTRVGNLETEVAALTGRVDKLEKMIQSVVIVPAYSDGSVEVKDDTLSIDFAVTPKDAMSELSKTDVKILLNKVQTKAVALDTVPADSIKVFTKDTKNGTVSIKANISEIIANLEDMSLTMALNVSNGISDFTTEFVPVTVAAAKPIVEYVEIGGLKWATKNLGATTVAGNLSTCAGDYYQWGSVNTLYNEIPWNSLSEGSLTITSWKTGKTDGFVKSNNPHYSSSAYTKYTSTDGKTVLEASDDAVAAAYPGTDWRMPTSQEFMDLYEACGGSYDTGTYASTACGESTTIASKGVYRCGNYEGVAGYLFYDGTNKLFFPAAGRGDETNLDYAGDSDATGFYWSSSLITDDTNLAYFLYFDSSEVDPQSYGTRYNGFSVRPVSDL